MAGQGRRNRKGEGYPIELYIEGDTGITQQWERQQDKEAVAAFNRKVRAWGAAVNAALKSSIGQMIAEDKTLSASLRQNYRHWGKAPKAGQEITSIGFAFEEAGLYVHLGVGRGYNRDMLRKPKPWFDPVIEQHIPALEKIVADYCGDLFINTTRILINR